jgi:hypothetical protein
MRAATFILISALSFLFCMTNQTLAQCDGPLRQPHPNPYGPFNFETNSLHDLASNILPRNSGRSNFEYGIVSCVTNPDPDPNGRLKVHWLIPQVYGWVFNGHVLSVSRLTNDSSPSPQDGCLEYGNRGDSYFARFYATKDDLQNVQDEQKRGCRTVIANPRTQRSIIKKIEDFFMHFINYAPSDGKDPQHTMFKIEGVIGITGGKENSYTSFMEYSVTRVDSGGSIADLTLHPQFRGDAEVLLPTFQKQMGTGSLKVESKGKVSFRVEDIKNPKLTYASYAIHDRNNTAVAALSVPVFVPAR